MLRRALQMRSSRNMWSHGRQKVSTTSTRWTRLSQILIQRRSVETKIANLNWNRCRKLRHRRLKWLRDAPTRGREVRVRLIWTQGKDRRCKLPLWTSLPSVASPKSQRRDQRFSHLSTKTTIGELKTERPKNFRPIYKVWKISLKSAWGTYYFHKKSVL